MNLCATCGLDFGSISAFDAHRVGEYPQTGPSEWSDRVAAGLVHPELEWRPKLGRRCLTEAELHGSPRFAQNARGGWSFTRSLAYGQERSARRREASTRRS